MCYSSLLSTLYSLSIYLHSSISGRASTSHDLAFASLCQPIIDLSKLFASACALGVSFVGGAACGSGGSGPRTRHDAGAVPCFMRCVAMRATESLDQCETLTFADEIGDSGIGSSRL